MKRVKINEILLLSKIEKKAKRIVFHPRITVIRGANHVGKSSLLKSIYATFGADPELSHPKWKSAEVTSVIKFSVEENDYTILRRNRLYVIIDHSKEDLQTFGSVTNELGPYLASIFGIKMQTYDRTNKLITPPPAYFFLPFYVDQDSGWKKNWSSFAYLTQLKRNWKRDIAYFHTGIKPNEFYEIKSKIEMYNKENNELKSERIMTKSVLEKVTENIGDSVFEIDLSRFKKEIEELIHYYNHLKVEGEKFKEKIVTLKNYRINIEQQILILERSIKELVADYEFAIKSEDTIECPTCGTDFDNSFAERFSIAKDEERCKDLIIEKKLELNEIEKNISNEYDSFYRNNKLIKQIKDTLQKKQEKIKLKDVIQYEGKKEINDIVNIEIKELNQRIFENKDIIDDLYEELKLYENRKRENKIKNTYKKYMGLYLDKLDVNTIPQRSYASVYANIKESGSGLPRALLAYYYSFLKTIETYSTSVFFPIIIDSPNQQDQDQENLLKMINLILEEQPENSQLILGTVTLPKDVEIEGEIIELTDKYSLLQESEYDSVLQEVNTILELSINKKKNNE